MPSEIIYLNRNDLNLDNLKNLWKETFDFYIRLYFPNCKHDLLFLAMKSKYVFCFISFVDVKYVCAINLPSIKTTRCFWPYLS